MVTGQASQTNGETSEECQVVGGVLGSYGGAIFIKEQVSAAED